VIGTSGIELRLRLAIVDSGAAQNPIHATVVSADEPFFERHNHWCTAGKGVNSIRFQRQWQVRDGATRGPEQHSGISGTVYSTDDSVLRAGLGTSWRSGTLHYNSVPGLAVALPSTALMRSGNASNRSFCHRSQVVAHPWRDPVDAMRSVVRHNGGFGVNHCGADLRRRSPGGVGDRGEPSDNDGSLRRWHDTEGKLCVLAMARSRAHRANLDRGAPTQTRADALLPTISDEA
jgi:hypothetical protein